MKIISEATEDGWAVVVLLKMGSTYLVKLSPVGAWRSVLHVPAGERMGQFVNKLEVPANVVGAVIAEVDNLVRRAGGR